MLCTGQKTLIKSILELIKSVKRLQYYHENKEAIGDLVISLVSSLLKNK